MRLRRLPLEGAPPAARQSRFRGDRLVTPERWPVLDVIKGWFHRVVLSRLWLSYVVMCLAFFAFGIGTLNLFYLLRANGSLLAEHGWQAVMDGGAMQFIELLFSGFAAMAAYVVFKACEYRLVHWLADPKDSH